MFHELLIILIVFRFYADSIESNKSDTKLKIIGGLTVKNRSDFSYQVSPPFIWNENIQPVEISNYKVHTNAPCNVSGWGITDHELNVVSSNLKYVEVPIIAKSYCRKIYPEIISLKVICAGSYGRDSCQGDSGGGLVCNRTLAGVVSFGEGCGVNPGVYTDVYAYRSWIKYSMRTINSGLHEVPNNVFILFLQVSMIFSRIIPWNF
ncbi:trypsin-3-like isoform X3 [Coccinella septempunctata]|uniref:trypsin-3-like isoform X3 n=1 Tax=Coccinella septempunctata TaxID=41139 RepID=UPI001D0879D6|nr:trypsin-3-like isoform X3 [Coccinella septempunctata]